MQTRILHTEIWQDDFFSELNPNEKLLFIYFLTNERVNIIHLYQCNNARICSDTGIDTPIIVKAKALFQKSGKIYFFQNFIYLKNASRYETYTGSRNELAKSKLFARLSKLVLDWYNKISDTPIYTPMDRDYKSEIRNKKSETSNKKSEIRSSKDVINPDDIPF